MVNDETFRRIHTFIFDIDGVLTDGAVLVLENGLQARRMSIRDGFAIQLAVKCGYHLMAVSGSSPSPVVDRLNKLGVAEVHMSILDKKSFVLEYLGMKGLDRSGVLYMGDDLPDLGVMQIAGIAACPSDAAPEVIDAADYISEIKGGHGCVREVIEKVLRLNKHWQIREDVASR
jgi:3-deoxy-D-manno-octulosonate 8-phosphate phosphatase (KDO 8-P phosphatase)